jgi:hypothetical protein
MKELDCCEDFLEVKLNLAFLKSLTSFQKLEQLPTTVIVESENYISVRLESKVHPSDEGMRDRLFKGLPLIANKLIMSFIQNEVLLYHFYCHDMTVYSDQKDLRKTSRTNTFQNLDGAQVYHRVNFDLLDRETNLGHLNFRHFFVWESEQEIQIYIITN